MNNIVEEIIRWIYVNKMNDLYRLIDNLIDEMKNDEYGQWKDTYGTNKEDWRWISIYKNDPDLSDE